jgi:hypothetical protein
MADGKILVGFEKRNVLDPHEHLRFFLDCHYKRYVKHDPCQPIAALNGRQSLIARRVLMRREPRRPGRPDSTGQRDSASIGTRRTRPICFSPLSRPGGLTDGRAKLPGSPAKQIERCVISTFQVAESMALRASFANGRTCSGIENFGPGTIVLKLCNICDESPLGIRVNALSR